MLQIYAMSKMQVAREAINPTLLETCVQIVFFSFFLFIYFFFLLSPVSAKLS